MIARPGTASAGWLPAPGSRFDAVVVGAGPAGSAAAIGLARRGLDVLLVDRQMFPRYKVCGGCLGPRTTDSLRRLGLAAPVSRRATPLLRVEIATPTHRLTLPLVDSLAIERSELDALLARAAVTAGARLSAPVTARLGPTGATDRSLELRSPDGEVEIRAGVVIAADGLRGHLLADGRDRRRPPPGRRVGLGAIVPTTDDVYPQGTVAMAAGRAGYVGVVRLEGGRLDVAACIDPRALAGHGGPARVVAQILSAAGMAPLAAPERWTGTPPLRYRRRALHADRVLVIGDAAGFWEPFTGEGIAWALDAGIELAGTAAELARRWDGERAAGWARGYRRDLARRQRHSRLISRLAARPRIAGLALAALARWPALLDWLLPRPSLVDPRSADRGSA